MMNRILRIKYALLLILISLLSYGQILFMQPWQDDNALMFKLAHIQDRAGYLGYGVLGDGSYKYTASFYYPIYLIFGYNSYAFFGLALIFFILSVLVIYKIGGLIFGSKVGFLVGLVYSAGFIASDGFIRLFNSIITSISVILITLLLFFYFKFLKTNILKFYLCALLVFFLATELARARTHYLLAIILLFEIIYLVSRKQLKSLFYALLRLIPFIGIFYYYFIFNSDARSGNISEFVIGLTKGDFYLLYSFFSTLGNFLFPIWLIESLIKVQTYIFNKTNINIPLVLGIINLGVLFLLFYTRKIVNKKIVLGFGFLFIAWFFFVKSFFNHPTLNLSQRELIITNLGGIGVFGLFYLFFLLKKFRKLYLTLIGWVLLNILAYSVYSPTVSFFADNRYLAHSFFALVFLMGILVFNFKKNKFLFLFLLLWVGGNFYQNIISQKLILETRTLAINNFYRGLSQNLKKINHGDVIYFDISDEMKNDFANAFSVAQMPETTAIAWRYGIDRYDFDMVTDYKQLLEKINQNNLKPQQIHTFWFSKKGLEDTSLKTRSFLYEKDEFKKIEVVAKGNSVIEKEGERLVINNPEIEIDQGLNIDSLTDMEITFSLMGTPLEIEEFPIMNEIEKKDIYGQKIKAFEYEKERNNLKTLNYYVSNQWQDRVGENLNDNDLDTVWQSDRVLWEKEPPFIKIDLKKEIEVNKLVWINGFANNTPTNYQIEVSLNGNNWQKVKEKKINQRIDNKNPKIETFDSIKTRFVKVTFFETIMGDAPTIAEIWVVPTKYNDLDLANVNVILENPFGIINSKEDYSQSLETLGYMGKFKVYWQQNKNINWMTNGKMESNLIYDGLVHQYTMIIPQGGTKLEKVKLGDFTLPGMVRIQDIKIRNLNINHD